MSALMILRASVTAALLLAIPALAEERQPQQPAPQSAPRAPAKPHLAPVRRAPTATQRPLAALPSARPGATSPPRVPSSPSALPQARLEAMCVRYRVVYGMDCPSGNGSGTGGIGIWDDVGRLPLDSPAGR